MPATSAPEHSSTDFDKDRIKRLRVALGMTQLQFADALDCRQYSVNRWENGHQQVKSARIIRELLKLEGQVAAGA